jgi:hypothetical protein
MRVICPYCSKKALITSTNALNDQRTVHDLYCVCSNTATCGASFVFLLAHKHTLKPPANTVLEMARQLINSLSGEEQSRLKREMG